jgi:cold shock CspA family protein
MSDAQPERLAGIVDAWPARRFGFIRVDDFRVFVHASELPAGVDALKCGQAVTFRIGRDAQSRECACDVELASELISPNL